MENLQETAFEELHGFEAPKFNPHEIVAQADAKLFARFKRGAVLNVWRNSSPHNWWLSKRPGSESMLHHWGDRERPDAAFLLFAKQVEVSAQRVTYGGWMRGSDEGLPVGESWAYDADKYEASVAHWEQSVQRAALLNSLAGTLPVDAKALSRDERSVVRRVKRANDKTRSALIGGSIIERLIAMGLVLATAKGQLLGTELLATTPIPNGSPAAA